MSRPAQRCRSCSAFVILPAATHFLVSESVNGPGGTAFVQFIRKNCKLKTVALPAADRASRRGDERADQHRNEDVGRCLRRSLAGGVCGFLGLFFGGLHLGNNVINALLGVLLRQTGAGRDQLCQVGPVAGIETPVCDAPRQNAPGLSSCLLWAGIGFRLIGAEQAIGRFASTDRAGLPPPAKLRRLHSIRHSQLC